MVDGSWLMRSVAIVLGSVLACGVVWAGPEGGIGLPPLAEVTERDPGMDRWQVTGSLPGAMPVARRDFGLCLDRQGWSRKSTTVAGKPGAALSLTVDRPRGKNRPTWLPIAWNLVVVTKGGAPCCFLCCGPWSAEP